MSSRVRFVLVEPREAGNVGAAARAMKNFGFTEMTIVGEVPPLDPVAEWWASGAGDVVRGASRVGALREAVADAQVVVATTAARARPVERPLEPRQVSELRAALGDDQRIALVFGREDRGLTAEELALCGRTAVIPTSEMHPTMNLAQAVAIFAYEMREASGPPADTRELADAASLERLHEAARELLLETGFLHESNPDRIYDDLRAIAARAELDPREVTILLGILRQLRWWKEK